MPLYVALLYIVQLYAVRAALTRSHSLFISINTNASPDIANYKCKSSHENTHDYNYYFTSAYMSN